MSEFEEPLVTVFEGTGLSAESEAQAIHALLESSGIESLVVRENVPEIPVGTVEIKVIASQAERAQEVIREGQMAGPEAAEAAEAETEI
jgi:DNA invertase Pin-like site-specific DNA recombinase